MPPEADAPHHQIPEEYGDKAGEGRPHGPGDHGLRAEASNDEDVVKKQNNPPPAESASNHDAKGGLKGCALPTDCDFIRLMPPVTLTVMLKSSTLLLVEPFRPTCRVVERSVSLPKPCDGD